MAEPQAGGRGASVLEAEKALHIALAEMEGGHHDGGCITAGTGFRAGAEHGVEGFFDT